MIGQVAQLGDIWIINDHRLACGDAADSKLVAELMRGELASLCFTSPPYDNQRGYVSGKRINWDSLMRGAFACIPMAYDGQVLVNIGIIHKDKQVSMYWSDWLEWMRANGWRHFAWYVWDQGWGLPGSWFGRFASSFEFIFHFNRKRRQPNKILPCKNSGKVIAKDGQVVFRRRNGNHVKWLRPWQPTQNKKIPDSVVRINRHTGNIGEGIEHPAVFPVRLAEFICEAYTEMGDIVYDPFVGSGSSIIAAEQTGRVCRSIDIEPVYIDASIKRFKKKYPDATVVLAATGQTFEQVAMNRGKA